MWGPTEGSRPGGLAQGAPGKASREQLEPEPTGGALSRSQVRSQAEPEKGQQPRAGG